jgi:hypothetical protein
VLRYLLDENVRGPLWSALQRYNRKNDSPIDVVRVGDDPELPLGVPDDAILLWAGSHDRVLISHDRSTLPVHLAKLLAAGNHCPGIFIIRQRSGIAATVEILVQAAEASDPEEWRDRLHYIG